MENTPTKPAACSAVPEKRCFVCGVNVEILGRNWRNIFDTGGRGPKKPQFFDRRLAHVLKIENLTKKNTSYSCICKGCIVKLEKIERGLSLLEDFKSQYHGRTQRVKRQSTESPADRVHKQLATPRLGVSPDKWRRNILPNVSQQSANTQRAYTSSNILKERVDPQVQSESQNDVSSGESGNVTSATKSHTKNAAVEVTVHYPSTSCTFHVDNMYLQSAITKLSSGDIKGGIHHLFEMPCAFKVICQNMEWKLWNECRLLCSTGQPSMLRQTEPCDLQKLNTTKVAEEVAQKAPTVHNMLTAMTGLWDKGLQKMQSTSQKVIPALSVILKARNSQMSAFAFKNGIILHQCGLSSHALALMNKQHFSVSGPSVRHMLDRLGDGHDSQVLKWKEDLAHHNQKRRIVSLMINAYDSIDISGRKYIWEISPTEMNVNISEQTIDFAIQKYVKEKSESWCSSTYQEVWEAVLSGVKDGSSLDVALKSVRNSLEISVPSKFQIIGDNIDLEIKAKHMTSSNQNKSIHWFHTYAIKDIVDGNMHAHDPRPKLHDIPVQAFLPDNLDNALLLNDFISLWSRIVVSQIPDLHQLKKAAVWHIPHKYSQQMEKASVQVPLGIICRNENKSDEMINILEELHDRYVPNCDGDSKNTYSQIFFGGDQLTDERCRSAQKARSDGHTVRQKLDGLIPKVEDWHAFRTAFQLVIKLLRDPLSSVDKGTFFANATCINNSNAKKDAQDFYASVKEFFNLHVDVYITAATMTFWGMTALDDPVLPDEVKNGTLPEQREWLHQKTKELVEHFAMLSFSSPTRDGQGECTYPCRADQCSKVYKLKATRKSHEVKKHSLDIPDKGVAQTDNQGTNPQEDGKFNYGCSTISLGLLLRNGDDAVREGDGERIVRVWKFLLPLFKANRNTKYALAALRLQADLYSLLPGPLAHELIWNRTVSNRDGKGKHMSRDLRLEHLNKVAKDSLKSQGAMNLSEKLARRAGNAIGAVEALIKSACDDFSLKKVSSHHKKSSSERDFKVLLEQVFSEANLFEFQAGRSFTAFPQFKRNVLSNLDMKSFCKWIQHYKQLWQKDQDLKEL